MRRIFSLIAFLVFVKCSFSQGYPLVQNLGSDSTIVISKGALQSRLINVTYTDTAAANLQRIRQYPGAQIATTSGGINLWVRNTNATAWLPINTGSGNNIYTINGTLTGNRTLTGGGYPLTFTGLDKFVVSADSVRFTTGALNLSLTTDSASITKKLSYAGNYHNDFKQFTLVDKGYVDSVVASSPAGTVTSIATNNGSGITGGTITSTGTLAIDTTNVISTKANVTSGLAGKLNISDTAAMLAPYLRAIDTTSLSNRINLKLNISDTASMLGNYLNNVGYGLSKAGQVVSADSATLSNYYLRRKDSLTTTNPLGYVTKQILADTAAAIRSADAGGTVTSVGLTMPAAFNVGNSPITTAGTISVTAAGLVSQYIRGDGTLADFPGGGGGGGASISYYLNGSVNQGTFGGNTYYEMNKTPIFGAGTDFSINADGYIAQFITDAGDPGLLKIPGGNWNFETFFSASSGGGTPTYYVELYKYDGTTFTLIASGSTNPDAITGGTSVEAYFSTLPVPETVLLATDRLAVRIYVTHAGRTITLHTEDNNLCQVITTFTTGITALNGLTEQVQYFATGTSGTDFNISSSVATHTFNLPTASATNRGALSTTDWTTFNNKVGGSLISGYIPKATGTNTIDTSQLFQNGQNVGIGTLTPNGRLAIVDTGGFALKINYNSASNVSDSNAAIYAENNGLSSYVAIFNEKTTNNTGAQLPLLIESSLTTGTPQANMGTGMDFGTRDDANNRKLNRFIIRGTDPAAATYTSRAEFRLWNAGSQTTPYYWLGNGNMGLGTSTPDSNLTVVNGAYFQRGIRASGLPSAPGTKALRIDASGTLSYADTLIDAGGTVTSVATNNGTGITGGTITTSGTLAIDTTLISTRAWRQKGIDSLQANINLKLNISDTASMLSPYLRSNTAAATYVPQTRTITINGTSQDLSANRTYNVGTVTSVATNTGTGITGGTFTTSGTIAADTLLLSTRAWRQKGVDSVISVMGSRVSGTTNYVSKFTGTNTIGNSQIFDNATSVGIGTAFPSASYKLDVNGNINVSNAVNYSQGGTKYGWTYATVGAMAMEGLQGADISLGTGSGAVATERMVIKNSGNVGIGITPDSMLAVAQGTHLQRGVRMSGLPSAVGTKTLRIDASGTLSVADTLTNGISGSGTNNYITKFTGSGSVGNSSAQDNGTTFDVAIKGKFTGTSGSDILTLSAPTNGGKLTFAVGSSTTGSLGSALALFGSGVATDLGITAESSSKLFLGANNQIRATITAGGNFGIGTQSPDSMLTVTEGAYLQRGVRLSGLPTAPGTRALRVDANGTLSVSDTLTNGISGSGTTNYIPKFTSSSAIGNSNLQTDASGNLGLGVTPSAWTVGKAIEIGNIGNSLWAPSANNFQMMAGVAYVSNQYQYQVTGEAVTNYRQTLGEHRWYNAPSGTVNTQISFTQAMTLDASGNLGLGTISPDGKLDIAQAMTNGSTSAFTTPHLALTATSTTDNTGFVGMTFATSDNANYGYSYGALRSSGGLGDLIWRQHYNSAQGTELMRLSYSGNLGLGVTPSAWGSSYTAMQIGSATSLFNINAGSGYTFLSNNSYLNSSAQSVYINTGYATNYAQLVGEHRWSIAASGTAGNAISFTQAMTLDASGNLGIGTTNPLSRLHVNTGTNQNFRVRPGTDVGASNGIALNSRDDADGTLQQLSLRASDVLMLVTGNVGIGTTSPSQKLSLGSPLGISSGATVYASNDQASIMWSYEFTGIFPRHLDIIAAGSPDGTNGGSNIRFFTNPVTNAANSVERMRITSGGNVGIGTTTIGSTLQVNGNAAIGYSASTAAPTNGLAVSGNAGFGTTAPTVFANNTTVAINNVGGGAVLELQSNGTSATRFATSAGDGAIWEPRNLPFLIGTNNTERMRITSGGNAQYTGDPFIYSNTTAGGTAVHAGLRFHSTDKYIRFFTNDLGRMDITSGGDVGINTQTPNATFHVNGSVAAAISIKTATYTLTSSDYTVVFDLNGNATANLPSATTCSGRIYVIKINRTDVTDVLTIDPNGAQTIDGNATYDLQCQQAITIQSDGSNWRIIGDFLGGLNCL